MALGMALMRIYDMDEWAAAGMYLVRYFSLGWGMGLTRFGTSILG